jgi:hypothetical protein
MTLIIVEEIIMCASPKHGRLVAPLLIALVALVVTAVPAGAAEEVKPEFYAWDLRVDFEDGAPHAVLTNYNGLLEPPKILAWKAAEVQCTAQGPGQITYQNGVAVFDGASFLRCPIPLNIMPPADQCETTAYGNWWFSAEGTFQPVQAPNPIIWASDNSFSFGLPSDGTRARTRVQFPSQIYLSGLWPRDGAWNEVLMGQNGPMMLAATSEIPGLLENLDVSWEPFFSGVSATQVGHRMFAPSAVRQGKVDAAPLPYLPPPPFVDIGRNANAGAVFAGTLAYAEVDPPGCTVK